MYAIRSYYGRERSCGNAPRRKRKLAVPTGAIEACRGGAETCIGAAGLVYEEGLAGTYADPFGYGLCILLLGSYNFV